MADFYFYAEPDKLDLQLAEQAFGPAVSYSGKERFLVTSKHSTKTPSKVIAICTGHIVIIADKDAPSTLVNLVLKPSEQPSSTNLPYIKYFIYRGIERDSILDGNKIASENKNELTQSLWETQRKRNKSFDKSNGYSSGTTNDSNSPPLFSAVEAVIDTQLPSSTPLHKLFFKNEDGGSQKPEVSGGWGLGTFGTEFGFEILFDRPGFEPSLGDLELSENYLEADQLPATPTQAQEFQHWNNKERLLHFIDPCAFFGCFSKHRIRVFANGSSSKLPGKKIYSDLLRPYFANCNTVYLDIRNELDYSYDYFQNYRGFNPTDTSRNLKISLDDSVSDPSLFPEITYHNFGEYGWPILVLKTTDYAPSGITPELKVKLSFPKQDNSNPILFISRGKAKGGKFKGCSSDSCSGFLEFPMGSDFTESVELVLANYDDDGNLEPIANYLHLKYIRQNPQCEVSAGVSPAGKPNVALRGYYDLDNIFIPFDMVIPWGDSNTSDPNQYNQNWVYFNEVYVDALRTSGQSFMAYSGLAKDHDGGMTLFAIASHKIIAYRKARNTPFSLVGKKNKAEQDSFLDRIAKDHTLVGHRIQLDFGDPATDPYVLYFGNVDPSSLNKIDQVQVEDFAYIYLSANDFTIIESIINGTHPDYKIPLFLSGFKVHLGLKFLYRDQDTKGVEYSYYEFVLRGYAHPQDNLGNADTTKIELREIETGICHYRLFQRWTVEKIENDPPRFRGRGYSIETMGSHDFLEPNGASSLGIPKKKIVCNVHLYRGEGVSVSEFCEYMQYFRDNVQQIWNSTSNKGLAVVYNPHPTIPMAGTFNRGYIVDASGVRVMEANAKHFYELSSNEILLYVHPARHHARSHIFGNRRTGLMFFDKRGTPYFESQQNVPAHEFGHVLGLGDRYAYYAKVTPDPSGVGANSLSNNSYVVDPDDGSGPTCVYLEISEDQDYPIRYSWIHNLMSGIDIVPLTPSSDIEIEPTFIRFHEFLRPVPAIPNPNPANTLFYGDVCSFISPDQFKIVINYKVESRCRWLIFKAAVEGDFDGSFVGIRKIQGNREVVLDDTRSNQYTTYANGNTSDPQFNDYDHKMDERLKINPGINTSGRRDHSFGYYSPYCGGQSLNHHEPIPDVSLNQKDPPSSITTYSLETGGHAFGNLGINLIRRDLMRLRRAVLNNLADPIANPITNKIINMITPLNNNYEKTDWTNDHYSNLGIGDSSGFSIWNNGRSSDNNSAAINQRNLKSGIPGANNIPGSRPYNDRLIDIHSDARDLPTDSDGKKPKVQYSLLYHYYFNRRAIIVIMAENL